MARINVEDDWFLDPRRDALLLRVGLAVDTVALSAWRLAQGYYKKKKLVPVERFEALKHWQDFEAVGLAVKTDDGVYIKGQEKHFRWLIERSESGSIGGRVSAQRERDELGRLLPKQTPSNDQANAKQIQTSSSSSFSKKERHGGKLTFPASDKDFSTKVGANPLRGKYSPEFEELYAAYPKRDGDHGKKHAARSAERLFAEGLGDELKQAVNRYRRYCEDKGITGTDKVKQMKTFMGCWEEWKPKIQLVPDPGPLPRVGVSAKELALATKPEEKISEEL